MRRWSMSRSLVGGSGGSCRAGGAEMAFKDFGSAGWVGTEHEHIWGWLGKGFLGIVEGCRGDGRPAGFSAGAQRNDRRHLLLAGPYNAPRGASCIDVLKPTLLAANSPVIWTTDVKRSKIGQSAPVSGGSVQAGGIGMSIGRCWCRALDALKRGADRRRFEPVRIAENSVWRDTGRADG